MAMDAKQEQSWVEQLEVTGPIKSLMSFVDELERNYDRRVAAMHRDYEQDVAAILSSYREEKALFAETLAQHKSDICNLQAELSALQESYRVLNIEHKMTSESLATAKAAVATLTKELKSEQELMAIAEERIRSANEQIRQELVIEEIGVTELPTVHQPRFVKARRFIQQVLVAGLTRPILFSKTAQPVATTAEPSTEEPSSKSERFSY